MLFSRKAKGQHYEQLAERYLSASGLKPITSNYQKKCGELDLIMKDNSTIVFVEVKYRKSKNFGNAAEMVTYQKSKRIIKTAHYWLLDNNLSPHSTDYRFDVVAIHDSGHDIEWIKNAITQE